MRTNTNLPYIIITCHFRNVQYNIYKYWKDFIENGQEGYWEFFKRNFGKGSEWNTEILIRT